MDNKLQSILTTYWGFSDFRPLQEDIIRSVLAGHDTLALLPTGGGKSICYQVPGLAKEGICVVVTPLIALMKDQVQALKSKGIKAVGVYHGLSKMEIDVAIDNCVYGDIKFLYLSPERLTTDIIRSRIQKMRVNLLAIDEAHCISQWGYDFRPPYLRIAEIRELIPDTPVMALTATATNQVIEDIQEKLAFRKKHVFRKSFERKNLSYMVFREEDKLTKLLRICRKQQGVGIVYVRNRRKTREIAAYLQKNRISADFYHAGLTTLERDLKQSAWMKEKTRVIVSTNAFGMGIDKPNVRFVVHMDLPDSPEAYFQEAGRAGRDGQKSFAVLLYNELDIIELKKSHQQSFPPISYIKRVYGSLGNYHQLAEGSGKHQSNEFDLIDFSRNYDLDPILVFNSIRFLEKEGYLAMSDAMINPSRILFTVDKEDLYRFQVANPKYDTFIKLILRAYTGLFTEFVKIREQDLAKRADLAINQVYKMLEYLKQVNILQYEKQNNRPLLTWLENRLPADHLEITKENHKNREIFGQKRVEAMIEFVHSENTCRSLYLLAYFDEKNAMPCGHCDVCLNLKQQDVSQKEFDQLNGMIKEILSAHPSRLEDLVNNLATKIQEGKAIKAIQWLRDKGSIQESADGRLSWANQR